MSLVACVQGRSLEDFCEQGLRCALPGDWVFSLFQKVLIVTVCFNIVLIILF